MDALRSNIWRTVAMLGLTFGGGCYAGLGDGDQQADGSADGGSAGTGGGTDSSGDTDGSSELELPSPAPRVARLTHAQWENTVRDLFYLSEHTGYSELFREDPSASGYIFDNNAVVLEVDQALWGGYQKAAAGVAELVTSDPGVMAAILPPDGGDDAARAEQFIREFGKRAYRRPLEDAEVQSLRTLFNGASSLYEGLDPFSAGVRLVIETTLQSPHFLYKIERSTEVTGDVVELDGWELAQRLSYFLWNTMPDDALFAAVEAGELDDVDGVEAQAQRLLNDPRAAEVIQKFHAAFLEVEKFTHAAPHPEYFPGVSDRIGEMAVEENELFVREILLGRDGSWSDVLTSTETFVNAELASIYGIEGDFGDEFELVQLDPAQRKGVFTQVGFLAGNASSVHPDPIHRGVFIAKRIACTKIAAPPNGVPPLPPVEGKTNRQTVEEHTQSEPGCAACHAVLINPFGFPFEQYDAIGAFRTEDNGFPVDTKATVIINGETHEVGDALDLIDALANSPAVHECYLKYWVEYAHGRPSNDLDLPLVARLGSGSLEQASVKSLLVDLVTSQPFLTRSAEELP